MTDDATLEDDEQSPQWYRQQIKKAEQKVKELEGLVKANESAARRVAFMDAGIPETPQTKFFREHYPGELTAEAITAAAAESGFLAEQSPEVKEQVEQIDQQAQVAQSADEAVISGSDAEFIEELGRIAATAPRDQISKYMAETYRKFGRPTGTFE